jgi:dipeptidyl-peptidase-4
MKSLKTLSTVILCLAITFSGLRAQGYSEITLEDLFKKGSYRQASVYGYQSLSDGRSYTILEEGMKIVEYDYKTGEKIKELFNVDQLDSAYFNHIYQYDFNSGESKILLSTGVEKIYRHSFKAMYYIWDIELQSLQPLSEGGKQQLATFSPGGEKVAFVRENNLFIKHLKDSVEEQVTKDGLYNHVINGAPDWVYEEEFGFSKGFAWSPRGDRIAFYRFDESRVKLFNITMYKNQLYPENYSFKYPKAGEENSVVTIHVYHLKEKKFVQMDTGTETDQYIPRVKWTNDNQVLSIVKMNRLQNKVDIIMANSTTGTGNVVYSETNNKYISEINDNYPTFINEDNDFIIYSEKSGYKHLYLYNKEGRELRQLTKGNWPVEEFHGYNQGNKMVYYTSHEQSPLQTALYSIKINGRRKKKLSTHTGTNKPVFSEGLKYYLNYYSSATTPRVVTLHDESGKFIRKLVDNGGLNEKVKETGVPAREFFSFATNDTLQLNGWMIKPPGFDENKKYPVLMYVYGGPGSQTVTDSWNFGWFAYLAQKGYIVVSIDNRGTGGRGEDFKKVTYRELGKYETIDQVNGAMYLQSLHYVDGDRIGIFGWSYGGYMSSLCITKGAGIFSLAIAVAPVTNWRYYDTIYTERYMGLPRDNPEGYDNNSPINHAGKLEGNFLLIHGSGDDNVHLQNTLEFAEKLVQENKQFDMHVYPDKNHGIYGGNTTLHLYTKISNFLFEYL